MVHNEYESRAIHIRCELDPARTAASSVQNNGMRIDEVVVPTEEAQDELIWEGSVTGKLTVKDASHHDRDKGTLLQWRKKIWQQHIPPKASMFIWKCIHNRLSTDDNAKGHR